MHLNTLVKSLLLVYGKCPKTSKHFIPYFLCLNFVFKQLFLNILSKMVNSVDPDQTTPSALLAFAFLSD